MSAEPIAIPDGWLDEWTVAARKQESLPDNWVGYLFEAVRGQGMLVTGKCVTRLISRGFRKGDPCFRTADPASKRTVFVPRQAVKGGA